MHTGAEGGVHTGRGVNRWVQREGCTDGCRGRGTHIQVHREGYTQTGAQGGYTQGGVHAYGCRGRGTHRQVYREGYTGRGAHRQVQREYTWVAKLNGYTQGEDYIFSTVHISYLDCIFVVC